MVVSGRMMLSPNIQVWSWRGISAKIYTCFCTLLSSPHAILFTIRSFERGERDDPRLVPPHNGDRMADAKAQRYEDALSSLIDNLIPASDDDDDAIADERHETALDLARTILDEYVDRLCLCMVSLTISPATVLPQPRQTRIMPPT